MKKMFIVLFLLGLGGCAGQGPEPIKECEQLMVPLNIAIRNNDTVWVEQPMYTIHSVQQEEPTPEQDILSRGQKVIDAAIDMIANDTENATNPKKNRVGVYTSRAEMMAQMRALTNEIKRFQIPENVPERTDNGLERAHYPHVGLN